MVSTRKKARAELRRTAQKTELRRAVRGRAVLEPEEKPSKIKGFSPFPNCAKIELRQTPAQFINP